MDYILENEHLKCVIKSKGAELASMYSKKTSTEHMWQADPAVWGRHAPILFPIVGQVEDNTYRVGNKNYTLSQHGFARDEEMVVLENSDNHLVFSLTSNDKTLEKYPFRFELKISYTLQGGALTIGYQVINKDEGTIWFSIGAHPGFTCPFNEAEQFSDYYIQFEKQETASRLLFADGLLTGEELPFLEKEDKLPLSHQLFEGDAVIFENLTSKYCELKSNKHAHGLRFTFEGFPFLAFWTKPGANAPYVCIEPWYGIADTRGEQLDYTQKKGIQQLGQGKDFNASYTLTCF